MSKWIEYNGSGVIPNVTGKVFIRQFDGWESRSSDFVYIWNWGDFVTHYRIDDGREAEEEEMNAEKKFIVVWDDEKSCAVESSEEDAKNAIYNLIKRGYDKSEIFVYETTSVKSVKIVIE